GWSSKSALLPQKELDLANLYLENASKIKDPEIALVLCDEVKAALSRTKDAAKKHRTSPVSGEYQALCNDIAMTYFKHGEQLTNLGYGELAQVSYDKAKKWGLVEKVNQQGPSGTRNRDIASIPAKIFDQDMAPAVAKCALPEPGARLVSTPQLVYCLSLLPSASPPTELLNETERAWSQAKKEDEDEKERLHTLATGLIKVFFNDELKAPATVAEVVCLAPVLDQEQFRELLKIFVDGISKRTLLELHLLEGLAQLMRRATTRFLEADDLVQVLKVLSTRLKDTHQHSTQHIYKITLAVSHVLDAMADCHVKDLNRQILHAPLSEYLNELKDSSDPYLVYQAAYACQALQYVPDDEPVWQAALRRTGTVIGGVVRLASAVNGFDLKGFIDGLGNLQAELKKVYQVMKTGYDGVTSLLDSGRGFLESLNEGLSFSQKRAWYQALRGIDSLLQDGCFSMVKTLICEAPCRRDVAFQWGVCQRLGEIASNPLWDLNTHQSAVDFLGELYTNDAEWGQQAIVKQWILTILWKIVSQAGDVSQ
ncbi:hypothetical protein BGX27_002258, partial [Mortierella sp. AM989]